jgi:predicted ABC-type ATPase
LTDPIGNCILAGVNGAGKSTLYEALNELKGMPRINTDEIVKESLTIKSQG